jgi:chemotaxis protein MotB
MVRRASSAAIMGLALITLGCGGYSEEEWQAQLDKYNQLAAQNQNTEEELEVMKMKVAALEKELDALGFQLDEGGAERAKLMSALEEYKERAAALERIKARFEKLRAKLNELTKLGLQINIRKNRMVISLPGDVLFASGKDSLEDEGNEILAAVAKVIREDPELSKRTYQVAGHTDNEKIGSYRARQEFKDNWGLSLMRARTVLLYMVGSLNDEKDPGGGLDSSLWSASGYGDTDPIATNDDAEGRQKNRRVELVMMPNVEEMLDLKSLVDGDEKTKKAPAPASTESKPAAKPEEKKSTAKPQADAQPAATDKSSGGSEQKAPAAQAQTKSKS